MAAGRHELIATLARVAVEVAQEKGLTVRYYRAFESKGRLYAYIGYGGPDVPQAQVEFEVEHLCGQASDAPAQMHKAITDSLWERSL